MARYFDEGSFYGNHAERIVGKPANPYGAGWYTHRWESYAGSGWVQDFDSPSGTYGAGAIMEGDSVTHNAADGRANINAMWLHGKFWQEYIGFCVPWAGGPAIQYIHLLGYPTSERYADGFGIVRQQFQNGSIYWLPPYNPNDVQLHDLSDQRFGPNCDDPLPPPPTATPTRTNTPTRTPTPTFTPTPTPVDMDSDGFLNPTPPGAPPVNTDANYDNCPGVSNMDQVNTDGNFIDNSPPFASASDDKTAPLSDHLGNACDPDDDNDGVADTNEAAGCNGSGALNPLLADTDGDLFLDGIECTLGTSPGDVNSRPAIASCGPSGDADGDHIGDRNEVCHYNTDPGKIDSDGDRDQDGAHDGCEVASLNGDRLVSSGDQGMLAAGIAGAVPYTSNLDLNKDGVLSSGDQGIQGAILVPGGQCP